MKKKIMTVVMSLMMCFSVAACGGGEDKKKDDGIDPNATVTKEQYDKLRETKWYELTPEEMEQFLGVKYVEDEDSTESWGEGYLVVDFPGRMRILACTCCSRRMRTASIPLPA